MEPGVVVKDKESGGFILKFYPALLSLFYYWFWVQYILLHVTV